MSKQRILVIDGNYFCHRALGQINMGDSVNNLQTTMEQENFMTTMKAGLVSLWRTFNNDKQKLINNMVFVFDNKSWRKEIPAFKPYWLNDTRPIEYKENRKEKKEQSAINYDNFGILVNEFSDFVSNMFTTINIKGLEGDDALMLMSSKVSGNTNIELIVFCTDGDLDQIVKDNVILMRNIRSKSAPSGEFVVTLRKYTNVFESDINAFLANSLDKNDYNNLFTTIIGDTVGTNRIKRRINEGISIATPFRTALVKSICGDKKDNLFSLMAWKSKTGNLEYKITETHLEKAFAKHNIAMTEVNCQKVLSDKELLTNLLLSLKVICNQPEAPIKEILQHLKHNLQLNVLSKNNVPEKYLTEFESHWNIVEPLIQKEYDTTELFALKTYRKDSATDTFKNSLPDITI